MLSGSCPINSKSKYLRQSGNAALPSGTPSSTGAGKRTRAFLRNFVRRIQGTPGISCPARTCGAGDYKTAAGRPVSF